MTISKCPLSFDTMFYNQIDIFFVSHFNDLVPCYEKKLILQIHFPVFALS